MNERGLRDLAKRRGLFLGKLRGHPGYVLVELHSQAIIHPKILRDLEQAARLIRKRPLA